MAAAAIRFIRKYQFYNEIIYEIIYTSGRIFTIFDSKLPKTAVKYIETAEAREQFDYYHGKEVIYYMNGGSKK